MTIPRTRHVDGAVIVCYPEVPLFPFNHAADINVSEGGAKKLLDNVAEYLLARGAPYVCFRISPLTCPTSFSSLLEGNGFQSESEESVMVFKGKQVEDKISPDVKVKEISENEIDIYTKLLFAIFKMPIEWKKGLDRVLLKWMEEGAKCYLAWVEEKPVGTCTLFSIKKTGGIFNVGTSEQYRRRGIGTALTLRAVLDSTNEGNDLHTLQTEKGGDAERFYKKIGFITDHTVSWFVHRSST